MPYEVWVIDGTVERHVDNHEGEPPDQGEWLAYRNNEVDVEGIVREVRYIRQRDGSYLVKVLVNKR